MSVVFLEIYRGHVSAQGAETLTWVIFKYLVLQSGSINGGFDLSTVDVDQSEFNRSDRIRLLLLLGFQTIIVFSVFIDLDRSHSRW